MLNMTPTYIILKGCITMINLMRYISIIKLRCWCRMLYLQMRTKPNDTEKHIFLLTLNTQLIYDKVSISSQKGSQRCFRPHIYFVSAANLNITVTKFKCPCTIIHQVDYLKCIQQISIWLINSITYAIQHHQSRTTILC